MRPKQWIKNLLVFAAPAAAGVLDEGEHLAHSAVVFVAFCLAASGTYCINDALDAEGDRLHPVKRHRPVAAGSMTPGGATVLGLGLVVAALAVAALTAEAATVGVVAAYLALTTSYTFALKHLAVLDMVAVAAGFVLRAVAGAVGTDIPISNWYLIVASFGSLFLVAGKRATELELGPTASDHRRSLQDYSPAFLLLVQAVSLGVTLLAYCLWAFEKAELANTWFPWFELSIVPFVTLLLRYVLAHQSSDHAGIEDIVLGDRHLLVIGVLWALCVGGGVYLADTPPVLT